jgi:hypothetical protein
LKRALAQALKGGARGNDADGTDDDDDDDDGETAILALRFAEDAQAAIRQQADIARQIDAAQRVQADRNAILLLKLAKKRHSKQRRR